MGQQTYHLFLSNEFPILYICAFCLVIEFLLVSVSFFNLSLLLWTVNMNLSFINSIKICALLSIQISQTPSIYVYLIFYSS